MEEIEDTVSGELEIRFVQQQGLLMEVEIWLIAEGLKMQILPEGSEGPRSFWVGADDTLIVNGISMHVVSSEA